MMEGALFNPKVKDPVKGYLNKFNLNLCLTCGTCSNGCPITGTPGHGRLGHPEDTAHARFWHGGGGGAVQISLALHRLREGPQSVREMAGNTGLPVYTVSLRLNDLERRGLTELQSFAGSTPRFVRLAGCSSSVTA
jgi:hypothetical protein